MIGFRDCKIKEVGVGLIVHINQRCVELGVGPFTHGASIHADVVKTQSLK